MLKGDHINDFQFTCGDKVGLNVRKRVSFKYIDYTDSFVEASNGVWKTKDLCCSSAKELQKHKLST